MNADRTIEKRLIQLETQLAHQQHVCDQLNEVIVDQAKRIMKLERTVVQLETQVRDSLATTREIRDLADEKPPHY
jgi:uncharacterized coiled-coil protein SlyX